MVVGVLIEEDVDVSSLEVSSDVFSCWVDAVLLRSGLYEIETELGATLSELYIDEFPHEWIIKDIYFG